MTAQPLSPGRGRESGLQCAGEINSYRSPKSPKNLRLALRNGWPIENNPLRPGLRWTGSGALLFGTELVNDIEDFGYRQAAAHHPTIIGFGSPRDFIGRWLGHQVFFLRKINAYLLPINKVPCHGRVQRRRTPINKWLSRAPRFRMSGGDHTRFIFCGHQWGLVK